MQTKQGVGTVGRNLFSSVIFLRLVLLVLLLLLPRPLANLTGIGQLLVDVGEDEIKDLRVPADGLAFDTFLDVL